MVKSYVKKSKQKVHERYVCYNVKYVHLSAGQRSPSLTICHLAVDIDICLSPHPVRFRLV